MDEQTQTAMAASTAMMDEQTQTSEIFEPQHREVESLHPPDTMEQKHCLAMVEQEYSPRKAAQNYSSETVGEMYSPEKVVQARFPVKVHQRRCPEREDFATLLAKRQEQYAKMKMEKHRYVEAIIKVRGMVDDYETFLALHPKQLAMIKQKKRWSLKLHVINVSFLLFAGWKVSKPWPLTVFVFTVWT